MSNWTNLDAIPAFVGPHEGREYDLIMSGTKHLAMFEIEEGHQYDDYPDPRFEAAVTDGVLVKSSYVVDHVMPEGLEIATRVIMYAPKLEEWRISALQSVREIYARMGPGWRPDLERVIGYLLGYDDTDVELFIQRLIQRGAPMGLACPDRQEGNI